MPLKTRRVSRQAAPPLPIAASAAAAIPPPVDMPYPGSIDIHVDASDTAQGIFRVHETLPVQPGELVLLYPKWLPGNHSPTGPINKLAGLQVAAHGKALHWTRDSYDVHAFHIDVPKGVRTLDVDFQYLSARGPGEGPIEMTDTMLDLVWSKVSLYPAGHYTRGITFAPRVTLPKGWQFGTALETLAQQGDSWAFKPVAYNTLVDSPLYAGLHFQRVDLDPGAKVPVRMAIVADAAKDLVISARQLAAHRNLVKQAYKLYGSRHYDHYDFLLSLSDQLGGKGLEHKQSSEDGVRADYFTGWAHNAPRRDLLAHEYTHSWNGKFRRPADLWTPNFNVPMGGSLLWVYEGQTQYWGFVLTARAGLWTPEQFRDALAQVAARYDRGRPGFGWRTLADTTNDPTIALRSALPYRNWQMSEEYYSGGQLLWLAVDATLRALTRGRRSLDDFARAFFGVDDAVRTTRTYVFDDVVAALNGVAKYAWAEFLETRIQAHAAPLDSIAAAGWKLVYTATQSEYGKQQAKRSRTEPDFMYSIGLSLNKAGQVIDVRWDGPAFQAGVGGGAVLVAVDGQAYTAAVLTEAIRAAKGGTAPIALLLKYQDRYQTVAVACDVGLQYPHLVRNAGTPDYLAQITQAK